MLTGRKLYSVTEAYWIFHDGIRTMKYLSSSKRNKELSQKFIERIMLAVTEVNHCGLCSNFHSKRALESGMTNAEIQHMLKGIMDDVPSEELPAVMFAQHYADSRANPSQKSWKRIVDVYGKDKSYGILGAIRTIMIGNTFGIPWSSFFNRIRGKADPRSSLTYELSMMLGTVLMLVSFFHALFSNLLKKPIITF